MTYTNLTLGELLSSDNETIRRNAISILKQLQKWIDPFNPYKNPIAKNKIYTDLTLGELLMGKNEIILRNTTAILKQLQKQL